MRKNVLIAAVAVLLLSAFVCVSAASETADKESAVDDSSVQTQNSEALTAEEKEKAAEAYERFKEEGRAHIYEQGIEEQIEYIESLDS